MAAEEEKLAAQAGGLVKIVGCYLQWLRNGVGRIVPSANGVVGRESSFRQHKRHLRQRASCRNWHRLFEQKMFEFEMSVIRRGRIWKRLLTVGNVKGKSPCRTKTISGTLGIRDPTSWLPE